jgi:hypothetical protein
MRTDVEGATMKALTIDGLLQLAPGEQSKIAVEWA